MRIGLTLLYMLGLDVISFSISMSLLFFSVYWFSTKKKNWGEDAEFYFLLMAFQIFHVFFT
jgi:hypothetical protein